MLEEYLRRKGVLPAGKEPSTSNVLPVIARSIEAIGAEGGIYPDLAEMQPQVVAGENCLHFNGRTSILIRACSPSPNPWSRPEAGFA